MTSSILSEAIQVPADQAPAVAAKWGALWDAQNALFALSVDCSQSDVDAAFAAIEAAKAALWAAMVDACPAVKSWGLDPDAYPPTVRVEEDALFLLPHAALAQAIARFAVTP